MINIIKVPLKIFRKIFRLIFYTWEYFYFRTLYPKPSLRQGCSQRRLLVCGGEDLKAAAEYFRRIFPQQVYLKIKEADLICAHIFDLLGSGPTKLSKEGDGYQQIDWHSDFKSGYRWDPQIFSRYIRFGHIKNVDIIVPWELSRMQHLYILGEAFLLSGNRKYALEVKNQIIDWIKHNKYHFGVNWFTAMDSSIRVISWLFSIEFVLDEPDIFDKTFRKDFYASVSEHREFIRKNLQILPGGVKTNHYVAGIVGLLAISICCPFLKDSLHWKTFAIRELEEQLKKQIYIDGCDFEGSISYHLLVLELFFLASLIIERSGEKLSIDSEAKIKSMFEVCLNYLKPSGLAPQIGDNDNGRAFKFVTRNILDHRYILDLATTKYGENNFKLSCSEPAEEIFWIFGKKGYARYMQLTPRDKLFISKSLEEGGWYIIKDRDNYCFISCGRTGQGGRGGHAHNDKLSFELVFNGDNIIVDPGTYVYTSYPEERNKFRATSYHNLVYFEGLEQSRIGKDLFSLSNEAHIDNASLREEGASVVFTGKIVYQGVSHERHIKFNKGIAQLEIIDFITCPFNYRARILFHLAPGLDYEEGQSYIEKFGYPVAEIDMQDIRLLVQDYHYSPEYGIKENARCLYSEFTVGSKTREIVTHIKGL